MEFLHQWQTLLHLISLGKTSWSEGSSRPRWGSGDQQSSPLSCFFGANPVTQTWAYEQQPFVHCFWTEQWPKCWSKWVWGNFFKLFLEEICSGGLLLSNCGLKMSEPPGAASSLPWENLEGKCDDLRGTAFCFWPWNCITCTLIESVQLWENSCFIKSDLAEALFIIKANYKVYLKLFLFISFIRYLFPFLSLRTIMV